MKKNSAVNEIYDGVMAVNNGVTKKDIRKIFLWYDLLSYIIPFQLISILVYANDFKNYQFTVVSVLFIFVMDAIIRDALERDGKNYQKFKKYIPIVKLLAVPLIITGIITTAILVGTTFKII